MDIHLSDQDLRQMPSNLHTALLHWLKTRESAPTQKLARQKPNQLQDSSYQLALVFTNPVPRQKTKKVDHSHIRLSQLFDAGITKQGMAVRIKLKQDLARQKGQNYVDRLTISPKGTVAYKGEEFDKPSPLAKKVNGSPVNGWEYVEVKKDGQWVLLDECRKIWKQTND